MVTSLLTAGCVLKVESQVFSDEEFNACYRERPKWPYVDICTHPASHSEKMRSAKTVSDFV